MESRKITVVTEYDQTKRVINSTATTLAELKADMDVAGINYEGMSFFEGLSHSELLTDDAILPHDIPYNGGTTNELVFMLTVANRKIKSGAIARTDLYELIKKGNLEATCVETYGKNFTQCSNEQLLAIINEAAEETEKEVCECSLADVVIAIIGILVENSMISKRLANDFIKNIHKKHVEESSPYSDDEIKAMFSFI